MKTLGSFGMSRRLLTTNAVLALLSVGFAVSIIGKMTATHESAAPARPATTVAAVVASTADRVAATPTFYSTIGSRNVFSPTRADTQKTDAAITIIGQRLNLFGVVLAGERSIAYLGDATTKRVFGYRLGDSVAGGVIRAIEANRIVLERMNQRVDVQLHDPSKPRRTLAAASSTADAGDGAERPAPVDRPADTPVPAFRPPVRPALSRSPLGRSGPGTPGRQPTPSSITVPAVTLEALPKASGPGIIPANATSDDVSLR